MPLAWTRLALSDLVRLHGFLSVVDPESAARTVRQLVAAPTVLVANPRLGERLEEFDPREVRRLLVGRYEVRYELAGSTIHVLRLWHTREKR